jgi:p-aminobenzoyl-glutamate transporter AbgT
MCDKYFFIFLSVCAIMGCSVWITCELTKPKLTDPKAQIIWAAGHTNINIGLSGKDLADILKKQ